MDAKDKMIRRAVSFEEEQWEIKAESIRRKLNLNSKSAAVRYAIDKIYEEIKGVKDNE